MYRPKLSMRTVLLVTLLSQVLIVAFIVGYISFRSSEKSIRSLTNRSYMNENKALKAEISQFLQPPIEINTMQGNMISGGQLNYKNQDQLIDHFKNVASMRHTINSIYFANTEGGLANAGFDRDSNKPYVIETENFRSGVFSKFRLDHEGKKDSLIVTIPHFDARTRPWYKKAIESEEVIWSEVYQMTTGDALGLSASCAVRDKKGKLLGVIGVDLFLSYISTFLSQRDIIGSTFIMEDSGLLIASSDNVPLFFMSEDKKHNQRIRANSSNNVFVQKIARYMEQFYPNLGSIKEDTLMEFMDKNAKYLVLVSPFKISEDEVWLIVSGAPENLFLAEIHENNKVMLRYVLIFVLISILVALLLAKLLSDPLKKLDKSLHEISSGNWISNPKESFIKELDDLANETFKMNNSLQKLFLSLNKEIARRKMTEEQLQVSKEKAEESNRLKSSFLANMSHELRTPLSGVLGFSEILTETELDDNQLEMVNTINNSGKTLLNTLNLILDISRIESNSQNVHVTTFDLDKVIDRVSKLFSPLATVKGLEIKVISNLIDSNMQSDSSLIEHVLNELVNNAIKYSDEGIISIISSQREGFIDIEVLDNGIGIPEDKHETIFEAFRQASEGLNRRYDGSGLGLTLCRNYAKLLRGDIKVQSIMKQGSKFTLEIPRVIED